MKDAELGGAYGICGVEEKCLSWRNVKIRDHLEYLGVSGGIIFVAVFRKILLRNDSSPCFSVYFVSTLLNAKNLQAPLFRISKINATVLSI